MPASYFAHVAGGLARLACDNGDEMLTLAGVDGLRAEDADSWRALMDGDVHNAGVHCDDRARRGDGV